MSPTPDADVRAALDAAADLPGLPGGPGLHLDPAAVLDRGHRVVRRRRLVGAAVGAAVTAVVAVVAVQLGTGQTRALPPAGQRGGAPAATALSGEVSFGADPVGSSGTTTMRLAVQRIDADRVEETWTVLVDGRPVRTVRREARPLAVGQASLLLPPQSGDPHLAAGYVDTGSTRAIGLSLVTTDPLPSGATGDLGVTGAASSVTGSPTTSLFAVQSPAGTLARAVGISWDDVRPGTLTSLTRRAVVVDPLPAGTVAAVLRGLDGEQRLLWATADRIGLADPPVPGGRSADGPLQLYPWPTPGGRGTPNDRLFGWVTGSAAPVVRSSDPADAWTVSDTVVGGRRAFLLTSRREQFTGTLTVTGAGSTRTVDFARERATLLHPGGPSATASP